MDLTVCGFNCVCVVGKMRFHSLAEVTAVLTALRVALWKMFRHDA